MLLLGFAIVYAFMGKDHFNFDNSMVDALFYSASITSTTGFGQYHPQTDPAKFVTMIHQVVVLVGVFSIVNALLGIRPEATNVWWG